jgi:hypothetical protein
MSGLMPPRSRSATIAAFLLVVAAFYWLFLGAAGVSILLNRETHYYLRSLRALELLAAPVAMGMSALIAGVGLLFRRNWGRVLAITISGPSIVVGWIFLEPFLWLPSKYRTEAIVPNALPVIAGIGWLALLLGKRVRPSLLPRAKVEIYVNLFDEGTASLRATQALVLGNGLFELLPPKDYDPLDNRWECRPGSIVRGSKTKRGNASCLLAIPFEPS